MRRERPVISATASSPKWRRSWSKAEPTGGQQPEPADQVVAHADGFERLHRVAVLVMDGAAADVAALVLELLVEDGREGVLQEVEHVLARGDVDR